jgi:hypothetical protein
MTYIETGAGRSSLRSRGRPHPYFSWTVHLQVSSPFGCDELAEVEQDIEKIILTLPTWSHLCWRLLSLLVTGFLSHFLTIWDCRGWVPTTEVPDPVTLLQHCCVVRHGNQNDSYLSQLYKSRISGNSNLFICNWGYLLNYDTRLATLKPGRLNQDMWIDYTW